jgi:hypothetical protein
MEENTIFKINKEISSNEKKIIHLKNKLKRKNIDLSKKIIGNSIKYFDTYIKVSNSKIIHDDIFITGIIITNRKYKDIITYEVSNDSSFVISKNETLNIKHITNSEFNKYFEYVIEQIRLKI